jgi:fatty acid desaturase
MHAPQIIFIVLGLFELVAAAYLHGEPKGKFNLWVTIPNLMLIFGLLLWGGFFAH